MILETHEILLGKLRAYAAKDPLLAHVIPYTKKRFEATPNLTAHNWEHAYRDMLNAIVVGEAEGADMTIVLPAAVMHDIGFLYGASGDEHAAVGADRLGEYFHEAGLRIDPVKGEHIADCIRTHKGSSHEQSPVTLEAKVVADADMLEKFGVMGMYQLMRTYAEFGWPVATIIEKFSDMSRYEFITETGKKLGEPGRTYAQQFAAQLQKSNEPYGSYDL